MFLNTWQFTYRLTKHLLSHSRTFFHWPIIHLLLQTKEELVNNMKNQSQSSKNKLYTYPTNVFQHILHLTIWNSFHGRTQRWMIYAHYCQEDPRTLMEQCNKGKKVNFSYQVKSWNKLVKRQTWKYKNNNLLTMCLLSIHFHSILDSKRLDTWSASVTDFIWFQNL